MDRERIMEYVAEWFGVAPNEDGTFDISDYDWQSGCGFNGRWLCLEEVVKLIESICDNEGF